MKRKALTVGRLGTVDYLQALELQERLLIARQQEQVGDMLLLLEHPHVYTLGRGASESFVLTQPAEIPLHRVSRGGEVTYHGPGQLIGYPILKLEGADRDVHGYLRKLEESIICALRLCGIESSRRERLTGVWIGSRKVASIGVGIKRWVTWHGFAVNVATDLTRFDSIVPCGIEGCAMTSLAREGTSLSVDQFADLVEQEFGAEFGYSEMNTAGISELMDMRNSSAAIHA